MKLGVNEHIFKWFSPEVKEKHKHNIKEYIYNPFSKDNIDFPKVDISYSSTHMLTDCEKLYVISGFKSLDEIEKLMNLFNSVNKGII